MTPYLDKSVVQLNSILCKSWMLCMYLGDMLEKGGGVEEANRATVKNAEHFFLGVRAQHHKVFQFNH